MTKRTPKRPVTREKVIESQIIAFLRYKGLLVWKNENGAVFDEKRKSYRAFSPNRMRGLSDITGLMDDGTFFAIEVKSEKGRLSEHQKDFLAEVRARGCFAIVARSVEEVVEKLGLSDAQGAGR